MIFPSEEALSASAGHIIQAAAVARASELLEGTNPSRSRGTFFRSRKRHSIAEVYGWMGERIFRRAFRMSYDSFWRLHSVLLPHILTITERAQTYQKKGGRQGGNFSFPPIRNGEISASMRLGAALRYFAGGSPYDIMCVFCISYSEVLKSVWVLVDAINHCPQFHISYPASLEDQRRIASEFNSASTPKFRNCAGAIDGILIWTEKPSLAEAKSVGVDQKKFLCGRKHKFGLNCQAVSDCRGRILDISIKCGGSSSDCLAFEASELHRRLENGLMQQDVGNERFVLFGDNAYLNTPYMATPFTNVSGDANQAAEDSYNFYHSQLRIRVECCFGMLVQRWGILRMRMPHGLSIKKIIAMINALAKLHNFCIGEIDAYNLSGAGNGGGEGGPNEVGDVGHINEIYFDEDVGVGGVGGGEQGGLVEDDNDDAPPLLDRDVHNIECSVPGYVELLFDNIHQSIPVPTDLIHAGEHFVDVPECFLRRHKKNMTTGDLPRTKLLNLIVNGHWERPTRLEANYRRRSRSITK